MSKSAKGDPLLNRRISTRIGAVAPISSATFSHCSMIFRNAGSCTSSSKTTWGLAVTATTPLYGAMPSAWLNLTTGKVLQCRGRFGDGGITVIVAASPARNSSMTRGDSPSSVCIWALSSVGSRQTLTPWLPRPRTGFPTTGYRLMEATSWSRLSASLAIHERGDEPRSSRSLPFRYAMSSKFSARLGGWPTM